MKNWWAWTIIAMIWSGLAYVLGVDKNIGVLYDIGGCVFVLAMVVMLILFSIEILIWFQAGPFIPQ